MRRTKKRETQKLTTNQKSDAAGRDRISRLFLLLDEKLTLLEAGHGVEAEPLSSADNEKDARTMISLIRVYEKLVEMQERSEQKSDHKGGASTGRGGSGVGSDEAQTICRQLAERIERLQQQSGASKTARSSKRS